MMVVTNAKAREASISAVVTRCGCGKPASHLGAVCPHPSAVTDLGVIAYWHRNPLKRAWHWLRRIAGV
jgi:hypothetical protein